MCMCVCVWVGGRPARSRVHVDFIEPSANAQSEHKMPLQAARQAQLLLLLPLPKESFCRMGNMPKSMQCESTTVAAQCAVACQNIYCTDEERKCKGKVRERERGSKKVEGIESGRMLLKDSAGTCPRIRGKPTETLHEMQLS